jgi:CYTH domain-containing protein
MEEKIFDGMKYLIDYPDTAWLEALPNCRRVEIIQTYLKTDDGSEMRVRQRGADGHYIYYLTTKKPVSDVKRIEIERRLSKDEYLRLLMDADPDRRPIRKTRYCLTHENQYFEIDVYPFWKDQAIAEIELRDENLPVYFPEQLKIRREVTGEEAFKNAALARI